jgi:bacterioferritin-associated ferredoxin
MIVCSCTGVTDRDISQAIGWMRASDAHSLITPGKIYRALGKTPRCGGCIRLFVERMRCDDRTGVPAELQGLRQRAPATAARAA